MADAETDALIAARWPEKWAVTRTSKGRNNLRRRFKAAVRLDRLRDKGARCADCKHFDASLKYYRKPICEMGSDFHGYQIAEPDGLCVDFDKTSGIEQEEQGNA